MEPLVIDWGQRRSKNGENRSQYSCLLLIILFLSRLYDNFLNFSQVNSAEGILSNDEF